METSCGYRVSVIPVRSAPSFARAVIAALLALLFAFRLLGPAGFMPAFDHGAVTIVLCPDAGGGGPLAFDGAGHHHSKTKKAHQPCPYASSTSLGALDSDVIQLPDILVIAAALLLGRAFLFVERNRLRQRPPATGPPLPA